MIDIVNELHPNTKAYVRVWRADPAFQVEGADLPAPPASVALVLEGSATRNSKVAEMEIDRGGAAISASRLQVEVENDSMAGGAVISGAKRNRWRMKE